MDLFKARLAAIDFKSFPYVELLVLYNTVSMRRSEAIHELDDDEEITGRIEDYGTIIGAIKAAMYAKMDAQFFQIGDDPSVARSVDALLDKAFE
jgi:hypothetical protein